MLSFETNLCFTGRRFDAYFFFPFILLLFSVHVVNASNDNVIVVGFVHFCFFFLALSHSLSFSAGGWNIEILLKSAPVWWTPWKYTFLSLSLEVKNSNERGREIAHREKCTYLQSFRVICLHLRFALFLLSVWHFSMFVNFFFLIVYFDVFALNINRCWIGRAFFPPAFSNDFENCVLSFNCSTDFMLFVSLFTRFNKIQRLCVVSFLVVNIQFGVGDRFEWEIVCVCDFNVCLISTCVHSLNLNSHWMLYLEIRFGHIDLWNGFGFKRTV